MSIGNDFLFTMLDKGAVSDFIGYGPIKHLFRGNEEEPFEFIAGHCKKYAALPTIETVETHTGVDLKPAKEPFGYYFDLMQSRHIEVTLKKAMTQANGQLKDEGDPQAALVTLTDSIMELIKQKTQSEIHDFREAYEAVIGNYAAVYTGGDQYGLRFGWPTLDEMCGGAVAGDLISMVGRPSRGKTWFMLHAAMHQWLEAGSAFVLNPDADIPQHHSRMFVSMEMDVIPIEQRMAAMIARIPADKLKKAGLSSIALNKLKAKLKDVRKFCAPFWVINGNLTSTVEDIWLKARQLKPDAIFIDGAYLLKHPTVKDRYQRVAENVELIKRELSAIAPVTCSWQFAKPGKSKKGKDSGSTGTKDNFTMDDIGYTDAIAQVSSMVLGLLESDSIETLNRRKVSILKGRHGETGSFETEWDFEKTNFAQIIEEIVSELAFV